MEPHFLGLFCADRVIKENNGKTGIIGIFDRFNIREVNLPSPPFFVYAAVTNVTGKHEFAFNIVRDDSPNVVLSIGGEIDSQSAEGILELVFPANGVKFPKMGTYSLQFSLDNEVLCTRKITAAQPKSDTE